MGADLEVRVLRRPGRRDPREGQGSDREVWAGGSVERIRGLTYRNRIGGVCGRASGHVTAKLLRPRPERVNPAVVRRRSAFLPGEVSLYVRKGGAGQPAEREVSRGRSSRPWGW